MLLGTSGRPRLGATPSCTNDDDTAAIALVRVGVRVFVLQDPGFRVVVAAVGGVGVVGYGLADRPTVLELLVT
eukprot:SAG11_NODE_254_length_11587_cov_4.312913_14_plen_73_part_00